MDNPASRATITDVTNDPAQPAPGAPGDDDLDDDLDGDLDGDEALAREAELAGAEGAEDPDDGELATPLPGFAYDPMFGVVGGVGALEGRPDVPRLVGRWPGEVLLESRGRRAGAGSLAMTVVGFVVFVSFTCLALDVGPEAGRVLPWPGLRSVACSWIVWGVAGAVFAVGLAFQLIAQAAQVTFTSEGIGRSGKGGDAFVPWAAVRGYRPGVDVVLVECEPGHLVVPAPGEERAGEVMALLDARGVPRLEV